MTRDCDTNNRHSAVAQAPRIISNNIFVHLTALTTIAATGFTVALLHASLPTHWMPFVMVGRARGWTQRKILGVVALAGGGHVAVTTLLGIGLAWLGFELSDRFEQFVDRGIAGLLIAAGGFFWWRHLTGRGCGHAHRPGCDHAHDETEAATATASGKLTDRATIWTLFTLLAVSPCEAFLPVYLTAVPYRWR